VLYDQQTKVADTAVGAGWLGWIVSHASDAGPIIQDIAGICAIIATLFAIRYHIARTSYLKNLGNDNEPDPEA